MPPEAIREFLRRQPFEPFRIVVTDGKVYDVKHPDQVFLERMRLTVGLPTEKNVPYYPQSATISLLHVVRLERLDRQEPAANLN